MQFVERLGIDLKRSVFPSVPLDGAEHLGGHVLGGVPVILVPLLEYLDLTARDLNVQFDVLGQPRIGKVRRADEGRGTDHSQSGMSEVRLGVEFILAVDPATDLTRSDRFDDRGDAGQEIVLLLLRLQAGVETVGGGGQARRERRLGPQRDFVAQENANLLDRLPLFAECQERTISKYPVAMSIAFEIGHQSRR